MERFAFLGRPEPILVPRLTPANEPGAYLVFTSAQSIDAVAARCRRELQAFPGTWEVRLQGPIEVFGWSVRFDRDRLRRVYGGRRIEVARGPVIEGGRVAASITLISPYPDASFTRLHPGTLAIVAWVVERER